MPSPEMFIAFLAATAVFAYIPGPALLYTAAQTIARGRRAGYMAAAGIHLGCYPHVFAAAAGLSVLFAAVPVLYTVIKIAGAGYLVWLGVAMFRGEASPGDLATPLPKSAGRAFAESFLVELLNPKTALFFVAFLPQFVDPAGAWPVWVQFLALGTIVNLMFSSADVAVVAFAGPLIERLRRSAAASQVARRIGGGILIVLGVRLALDQR
ncbi:MAG: LysE family translocator [Rhodospirillales bacterium]